MDSEQVRGIIRRKEDAKLDFKIESKVINGIKDDKEWDEFLKDIISIANGNIGTATETGYLIIGAGDKLRPDGTRDLKDVGAVTIQEKQILDKLKSACEPRLPEIKCEVVSLDGKKLFIISIPPSPYLYTLTRYLQTPKKGYSPNTVLIRRKDGEEIYEADDHEKEILRKEKKNITSLNSFISIDCLVEELRNKCCDKIQHLYSKIKLLNRQSIDVDKLYVDVYLLEKISSDILATIDSLVNNSNLQDEFDRFGLGQRRDRKDGFTVAKNHNRLMILGKPGSGKTTFLRHLAVACCQGEFKSENIPVFIELRSITNANQFNLFNEIYKEFDFPNQEQTKQILKQGKVLIFLDGLDEVPTESRRNVQKQIDEFSQNSLYYKNHFIITCRTQTTEYTLQNFDYVEVADFNPEQVEKFSRNWFTTLAKTHQKGEELTAKFLEKLRLPENKQIAELAVTPILLSLTCWIFGESKDLPSKRSQLYQRGINLLLKEWDEKRDIQRDLGSERYRNLSLEDKQKLLSYVAYRKFNQEQYALFKESEIQKYIAEYLKETSNNDIQSVVKTIEAQHGLLIQRAQDIDSEGIYSFSHLTFQEYFTAKYIVENQQIEQLVKEHLTDTRWREVFLLTAELMGNNVGNLLSLMQAESQKYINTPKLQNLLHWANQITSGTAGNIKPLAKRIIAIEIVFDIAHAIAYADTNANLILLINADSYTDTKTDNTFDSAIASYIKAQSNTIVSAKFISSKINSAIADTYAYAIINNEYLAYSKTNAIEYAINKVIDATDELEQLQIFNDEEFTNLAVNLSKLKGEIPKYKQPQEKFNKFIEEFQITLLHGFKIMSEMINLSNEDLEKIQEKYLYANELIIDCKTSASGETPPFWWQEIEDRMLKPNL
ncbi:MAG: NACHT domain-containing protein [Aphanizomenon gracile PMC638.10]|nr:NACHT domain-containing protein [Aphanizomenon gracile PMC638.10]